MEGMEWMEEMEWMEWMDESRKGGGAHAATVGLIEFMAYRPAFIPTYLHKSKNQVHTRGYPMRMRPPVTPVATLDRYNGSRETTAPRWCSIPDGW